jgi:hypothetical protein
MKSGRFGSPGGRFAKLAVFRHHIESVTGFPYAYQEAISLFRAAMPAEPYCFAEWRLRRVGVDYHVELEGHLQRGYLRSNAGGLPLPNVDVWALILQPTTMIRGLWMAPYAGTMASPIGAQRCSTFSITYIYSTVEKLGQKRRRAADRKQKRSQRDGRRDDGGWVICAL